ncbi:MAG: IS66 family insertion sequence element accessory protein TnpB [Bacteroides caccae]|nr:IS66 family insertion sequence element accessory protein TnpB [Bacteroides caccae]
MFCLNDSMRYFLCPGYTDMRKGMFTLCGLVHERMGGDIRSGEVFIFYNRFRTKIKLLHAEPGGLVLYEKLLEEGTFKIPAYNPATRSYPMTWSDLVVMVEGINEDVSKGRQRRLFFDYLYIIKKKILNGKRRCNRTSCGTLNGAAAGYQP